jgi:uncharacterized protein YprB with RNaseH-like and TPR domain
VWGLWNENIPLSRMIESSYVLCWAAKWYQNDEIMFSSIQRTKPKTMLKRIHNLLDEADAVIHYNGTRFDIPTLNKEFLLYGIKPPSPYKQIDLLKVARNQFKFPSNKLDYVAEALGLGKKHPTTFDMWVKCMQKDPEAWAKMEEYNKNDVVLLEAVYDQFRPWIKSHPNHSVYSGGLVCPNCGSDHYHQRGTAVTSSLVYKRFQCQNCGSWFRASKSDGPKAGEKFA